MSEPAAQKTSPLPTHKLREIAARAGADERTVRKLLLGERVMPMPAERIRRAMAELGIQAEVTR